jgi:hypothetical protein
MKKIFALSAIVLLQALPVSAQQYHYHYGDSRVTNQNQIGLYTPSSTYIGAGTLSRSAQGKQAGVGGALPQVNMGSHVRTAGDNLYNNQGTERESNGSLVYSDQLARREAIRAEQYRRQQQQMMMQRARMRQNYQQQQQGYTYIPGSNGAAASYANAPSAPVTFQNGAASYGSTQNNNAKARQF